MKPILVVERHRRMVPVGALRIRSIMAR
jgi:hypothetical protein